MVSATICRTYRFEAAHQLRSLPLSHKCSRMHGHTYRVDISLRGEIRPEGMVLDFGALDLVMDCFLKQVDHKVLNHVPGLEQDPTAENIALWFGRMISDSLNQTITVRVWENESCWAEVEVTP